MKHKVTEHKLAGGSKALVVHMPDAPVISLEITFNSGFQFSPKGKFELSHVFEHLAATVARKSYPEHNGIFIAIGMNGAYTNAYTSSTNNGYVFEFAAFELERMLGILDEYLTAPIFTPEGLKSEISNVREELTRNTTNYSSIAYLLLLEKVFPGQYLNWDKRLSELGSITVEDATKFYRSTHNQANARVYIGGDFPDGGAATVRRIEAVMAKLPRGERFEINTEPGRGQSKPLYEHYDIQQTNYMLATYSDSIEFEDRAALTLMRTILTGGMPARIYGKARLRGLAYGVGGSTSWGPGSSSWSLSGHVTPGNARELFELFSSEVVRLRGGDLADDELVAAKDRLIGGIMRTHQKAGDFLDWYAGFYNVEDRVVDFEGYLERVRKVTPYEVIKMAQRMTPGQSHGVSFVGPVDEKLANEYAKILEPIWEA